MIDIEAGLSQCWTFRMPPDFCASAGPEPTRTIIKAPTEAMAVRLRFIELFAPFVSCALFVEPYVFQPYPVVDRVHHHRVALDVGMPAGARAAVIEDRTGDVLGQLLLDLPDQLLALLLVELHRLPVDHLVELGTAVAVVVGLGIAGVELVERLIRV